MSDKVDEQRRDLTAKDRPDQTGICLLQSLHVLREMEKMEIERLNNQYPDREINPVHPYAWGLFKTTLLKATKNRDDLKRWSPDLFDTDKVCHHCKGEGKNPIAHDTPLYLQTIKDGFCEPGDFKDGDPLWSHCSPCQGSGILTKLDLLYEEMYK